MFFVVLLAVSGLVSFIFVELFLELRQTNFTTLTLVWGEYFFSIRLYVLLM